MNRDQSPENAETIRVCIGICMSEYRDEMVKTCTAEATSLKITYIPYVFETFLQVVALISI